jgi:hypothetical protein
MTDPLVEAEELLRRLPEADTDADLTRAEALLEDASALVRHFGDAGWLIGYTPDVVTMIVIKIALRAFQNPGGVTQESEGATYSASFGTEPGVYLTAEERDIIVGATGSRGPYTLTTTRAWEPDFSLETGW